MELNEYQERCSATAYFPPERGLEYCTIALCGEAGEFANVVKKIVRDGELYNPSNKRQDQLELELGDTLWYLAQAAHCLGCDLQYIAERNLEKLEKRHAQRIAGQKIT